MKLLNVTAEGLVQWKTTGDSVRRCNLTKTIKTLIHRVKPLALEQCIVSVFTSKLASPSQFIIH